MTLNRNVFLSIIMILFFSITTNQAYAESTSNNNVSWQIIFLADKSNCNIYEKNRMHTIEDLTEKYFELYKFNNQLLESICLFSEQYFDSSFSNNADLNIIVFDKIIGDTIFVKHGYDGLYAHFGADRSQNHVIMVVESPQYSSSFDFTEPSWNLSHQISHFILSYYGYNLESIERLLHSGELQYSDCSNKNGIKECSEIKSIIHSDITGEKLSVVAHISEIIDQNSMEYFSNDLYSSTVVKKLQHEITGWWIEGIIDDKLYLNAIKQIVDVSISGNKTISTNQLSILNGFSILDKTLKHKNEKNSEDVLIIPIENKIYESLNYIPFDTNLIASESDSSEIPNWFKNRAKIWYDQKLDDRIFFDGLDALIRNGYIQEN